MNYQHSQFLAAQGPLTPGGPLYYGVTTASFPNHFVLTGTYYLPFGKGQRFLGSVNKWVNAFIGGWVVNAFYTWESRAPIQWGNVVYLSGDLHLDPRNLNAAFDMTRFDRNNNDQPTQCNIRTFPQLFNNLRSDATNNADLSALKNFNLGEKVTLQYRFEAFNALNYVQFDMPNVSPTSTGFGTIASQANTARTIQMRLRLAF